MSIKYVILGYISWQPMTGYDVKKIIAESETLPWSASNNQIYHALVDLTKLGWVTKSVEIQEGSPNRNIYTITVEGKQALKDWSGSVPELPQTKNTSLHQLMWGDNLSPQELDQFLDAYLDMIGEKLFFLRVQADERKHMPDRTPREKYLWDMIYKNWIGQYEFEVNWIRQLRRELSSGQY